MEICLPSQNSNIQLIDVLLYFSFPYERARGREKLIDIGDEEIVTNTELTIA